MNFIKEMDDKFSTLSHSMEVLSEGFYVDFFPNLAYNNKLIDLLDILMGEPNHDQSLISYFIYDLDYGTAEHAEEAIVFLSNNIVFDLTTPELLYDALVEINFIHPELYYNDTPKQKHKLDELLKAAETSKKEADK